MNSRIAVTLLLLSIAAPVSAITRTFYGTNWSQTTNWQPNGLPSPEDTLVFHTVGYGRTQPSTNDLPVGTVFGPMLFQLPYEVNGNLLTVTGDITFDETHSSGYYFECHAPLRLANSIRLGGASSRVLASVDVNGKTLTVDDGDGPTWIGSLNGSGSVVANGALVMDLGGGDFRGNINGSFCVDGALPGATVAAPVLCGNGTLGTVTSAGFVDPGTYPRETGTLNTGSIVLNDYAVDILWTGAFDRLNVTGTVTIGGSLLIRPERAPIGQSFTIIDNDGTDPIIGTFAGLPEGAEFTVGAPRFRITYHGGDGNDVVLTTIAGPKQWTGAASGNWSDPRNWSPQELPLYGESLVFPSSVATPTMNNDLPAGTVVGSLSVWETPSQHYVINGNPLTVLGDVITNGSPAVGVPLTLGNSINMRLTEAAAIDVNGKTLSIYESPWMRVHALNGSGTVNGSAYYGNGMIIDGGTFTGTINGNVDIRGSLPNANVVGFLTGEGIVGNVNGGLRPGIGEWDSHATGLLRTGSLTLRSLRVDLVADGSCDRIEVVGTVHMDGSLGVGSVSGNLSLGQTFVIIDNDGTDPISGTFTNNLPEGAVFNVGDTQFRISYRGGDGNDVVLTVVAIPAIWTGAASGLWSDPRNWSPQSVPSAGQTLIFPAGASNTAMVNDLPPTMTFGLMRFRQSYVISGNAMTLAGDFVFDESPDSVNFLCHVPLTVTKNITLGGAAAAAYDGGIEVPSGLQLNVTSRKVMLQHLAGSGTIAFYYSTVAAIVGDHSFGGRIQGGLIDLNGSLASATVIAGARLSGNGTIGSLTIPYWGQLAPGSWPADAGDTDPHTIGIIRVGSVVFDGTYDADIMPDGTSDRLYVSGIVRVPAITPNICGAPPPVGQSVTLIDKVALGPILYCNPWPWRVGPWTFAESCTGGDGNDVTVTRLPDVTVTLSQDLPTTVYGQPFTVTATVSSPYGEPTGTVNFDYYNIHFENVPIHDGKATVTVIPVWRPPWEFPPMGTYAINAWFEPAPGWAYAQLATMTHTLLRANTTTTVTLLDPAIVCGKSMRAAVDVVPVPPPPSNMYDRVSLSVDGAPALYQQLSEGRATFDVGVLALGPHTFVASYSGGMGCAGSESGLLSIEVTRAATLTDVRVAPSPSYAGAGVSLSASIRSPQSPTTPSGIIVVAENGRIVGETALANGSGSVSMQGMAVGEHEIHVSYGGDACSEPSSAVVRHTVLPAAILVSDAMTTGEVPHTISIPVHLSGMLSVAASVDYETVDDTATAGSAYEAASGTITFAPGQNAATLTLNIIGNATADSLMFRVVFSNALNAAIVTESIRVAIAGSRTATTFEYAPGLTIDLYPPVTATDRPPLILAIPGTAAYDSGRGAIAALRETSRGYAVARVGYHPAINYHFPSQLVDLNAAVSWIRANAAMLNVDGQRIGAWGFGTGAHLATLLGRSADANLLAIVEQGGASDLPALDSDALACSTVTHSGDDSAEAFLLGCTFAACSTKTLEASPAREVPSSSAATMIVHGDADCVIPPNQAMRLYDGLRAAGVYAQLRMLTGIGHLDVSGTPPLSDDIDAFLDVHLMHSGARPRPSHH